VPNLACVETVDDEKVASKLNSACTAAERTENLSIYLQVRLQLQVEVAVAVA
jgi:uncharacterized pyridoxal phosphate-containing UPF0001 family protein